MERGELDRAIVEFQKTRNDPSLELQLLGRAFAQKPGFGMVDLALKQFRKGIEAKGHPPEASLPLRYDLAMLWGTEDPLRNRHRLP